MKWYWKIGIGLIIGIIAYLIGNWIPIKHLTPDIEIIKVNSSDYLKIIISSISAIVTFLAVIVALFKEDIRKFWEFSDLQVSVPDNSIVEKLNSQSSSSQKDQEVHLEAECYNTRIEIVNSGNISSISSEIYLEKLEFNTEGFTNPQQIETSGSPLNLEWNG